jgi:hypothetical protein
VLVVIGIVLRIAAVLVLFTRKESPRPGAASGH